MTRLYAQPYDISAPGFFFETTEEYMQKVAQIINNYGLPIEEFEIQFIDGEDIDAVLFEALRVHQENFPAFLRAVEEWSDDDKIRTIIAVGEAGYSFDFTGEAPDFDVELYEMDSLRDLAYHFVDEGLYGELLPYAKHYLDYDAIALDLGMDYSEIVIARTRYVYRVY